ncbi:hypothetical protein [Winogradskyella schleiferi]|uniref:hypothetical protein n=1 Tax=Winogradskyella schleiferi TaxID=2686078 RepID=UPI0015BD9443|nr:hypothetical protein [Winogradskyella schleiferi]
MRNALSFMLFIFCVFPIFGQIKTASGDISVLAGEKELSVSFGYDHIKIHGFDSEEEFIKDKVKIREDHKLGTGKQFRDSWFADRDTVYAPLFIKHLNHALPDERKISVSRNNPEAKYNLHVETLWVYPGYNVGMQQPAKIEVRLQLYDVESPEKIIWESKSPIRIKAKEAPFKREERIGAAYTALAISMSWFLKKKAK